MLLLLRVSTTVLLSHTPPALSDSLLVCDKIRNKSNQSYFLAPLASSPSPLFEMSSLISAAFCSCRSLNHLKRMTAITPSAGVAVSRSPFTTTATIKSGDKGTNKEQAVSPAGAAASKVEVGGDGKATAGEEKLEEVTEVILKEIPDSKIHWEYQQSNETAIVYDRKPIRIKCKEGRIYMWCACGMSRNQPFCDGTHKIIQFNISLKPIPWSCRKTGYYWFCNCKKSGKKVFCDGTHIQLQEDPSVNPTIKF